MKIIYADTVLVCNAFIDCVILFITSVFLQINVKFVRLLLSSVFGGVYSIFILIISPRFVVRVVFQIAALMVMNYICFGKRRLKINIKIVASEISFSVLLGGIIMLALENFNFRHDLILLTVCAAVLAVASRFGISLFRNDISRKTVDVVIEKNGKRCKCSLMCDSGNLLVDPYNLLPVILLDSRKRDMISESFDENFAEAAVRFVPLKTCSGKTLARVFTPDSITVGGIKENKIKASVGFVDNECFYLENCDGIIPGVLIENI